jgi:hypothetical protein
MLNALGRCLLYVGAFLVGRSRSQDDGVRSLYIRQKNLLDIAARSMTGVDCSDLGKKVRYFIAGTEVPRDAFLHHIDKNDTLKAQFSWVYEVDAC